LDPIPIGRLDIETNAVDVALIGGGACLLAAADGVHVIDLQRITQPKRVGRYPSSAQTRAMAVSGDLVYLADALNKFEVIDTSDRAAPMLLGTLAIGARTVDLAVDGQFTYAACDEAGLRVIDVSNPRAPRQVGVFDTSGRAWGVWAGAGYAYVADGWAGVQMLDVSNPRAPRHVGGYVTTGFASHVGVVGTYAYAANGSDAAMVLNVSDPSAPFQVGRFPQEAGRVAVDEDRVGLLDWDSGLHIFDVTDPTQPRRIARYDPPAGIAGVEFEGDYAYVASSSTDAKAGGLEVVALTNPANPQLIGRGIGVETLTSIQVIGSQAYVGTPSGGLKVFDLTNPTEPRLSRDLDIGGQVQGFALAGSYAYMAVAKQGLAVFEMTDPTNPKRVGSYSPPGEFEALWFGSGGVNLDGGHAYVTSLYYSGDITIFGPWTRIDVIDVSNPTQPKRIGGVDWFRGQYAWARANQHLYGLVTQIDWLGRSYSTFTVFDIGSLVNPRRVATVPLAVGPGVIKFLGQKAYLADSSYGLRVLDISNLSSPQLLGDLRIARSVSGLAVEAEGNYAYVVGWSAGLHVIDISDPSKLTRVGGNPIPSLSSVALAGDNLLATSNNSLIVFGKFQPPSLRLTPIRVSQGAFEFSLQGRVGWEVRVEQSSSLRNWQSWSNLTLPAGPVTLSVPLDALSGRFFRAAVP
jgi:hypothetical protein